jgi:hypothetical protein
VAHWGEMPGKQNWMLAVVYFAFGPVALYLTRKAYGSALIAFIVFSVCFGVLLLLDQKQPSFLDAHRWTVSSMKGVVGFVAMLLCWLPLYCETEAVRIFSLLYFVVAGAILGESLYFLDYLQPVEGYQDERTEQKALDMEHREVVALITPLAQALLIIFITGLGVFVLGQVKEPLNKILFADVYTYIALGTHAAVGDILWIIRPIHARAKGIRVAFRKFKDRP